MIKSFEKWTIKILLLVGVFLLFTIGIFCFVFLKYSEEPKETVLPEVSFKSFCGTKNSYENPTEGKQLFNSYCAVCHKLDSKMTGPALRNTDSIVFRKWLYYQKAKIDTTKLHRLGIDYHRNLSKRLFKVEDLNKIYAYIGE